MLLGDHGFLDGVHAAHRRAVSIVAAVLIPRSHALQPGDLLGLLVIGHAYQVPGGGAGGRQDALELDGTHHIGIRAIPEKIQAGRIVWCKSGRKDYRTDVEFDLPVLHLMGGKRHGTGATGLHALVALAAVAAVQAARRFGLPSSSLRPSSTSLKFPWRASGASSRTLARAATGSPLGTGR